MGDLPDLALCNNLPERIGEANAAVGLVGLVEYGKLVYCTYCSRVLKEPNAVIARGRSSSGKSTVLRKPALLFPDSVKIEAMAMTGAAWFNTDADHFVHKAFIAGERKHSQDETAKDAGGLLRQLLSERFIDRGVSMFDKETKKWKTEWIKRKGPIAYAESSSSKSVFSDDLTRMLEIHVEADEKQVTDVLHSMSRRYAIDAVKPDVKSLITQHHEFQEWLQEQPEMEVAIPYHEIVMDALPKQPEAMRVAQQVSSLIEILAVMQYHQRQDAKNGKLIASVDDYEAARRMVEPCVAKALGCGKEVYVLARQLRESLEKRTEYIDEDRNVFSTPQVKQCMGHTDDMATSRLLMKMVKGGFVERLREHSGPIAATYRWSDRDLDVEELVGTLPGRDEVLRECAERGIALTPTLRTYRAGP
jgi:hypothetical protein